MKDIHSAMLAGVAIGAAVLVADNIPPTIDLQDFNAAEIILSVGVGGITFDATNKIEFKLTHSDDDLTYTAVPDADVLGVTVGDGGIIKALTEVHTAAAVYRAGYVGGKRYLKLLADFSGTHGTGTPIAATVIKMRPYDAPQADQA